MPKPPTSQRGKNTQPSSAPASVPRQEVRSIAQQVVRAEIQQQHFSGPLPPPEVLRMYDQIIPGAAERIIRMAETQMAHRHDLESRATDSQIALASRGQVIGGVVAVTGLIAAAGVGIWGSPVVGGAIAAMDITGLAGVFIYGAWSQKRERLDRMKILTNDDPR